jgi:hypothetical protein
MASCNSVSDKNKVSATAGTDTTPSTEIRNDTLDVIVQTLLEASSNDFYRNQPPLPVDFRNMQLKYLEKANGERNYMICGQFLARDGQNQEKWTNFTTIKTSDYEQWIGSNAVAYCQEAKDVSYNTSDLSAELKNRVDSLQPKEK